MAQTHPRPALLQDAADIAKIHCAAWYETYSSLLPEAVIAAASDFQRRHLQWKTLLTRADLRIAIIESLGFACMGPQRDPKVKDLGYPEELWAIYLLRQGQGLGLGQALLQAVLTTPQAPFSILVVSGNQRAISFYRRIGASLLAERPEQIGGYPIIEQVLGWAPPA